MPADPEAVKARTIRLAVACSNFSTPEVDISEVNVTRQQWCSPELLWVIRTMPDHNGETPAVTAKSSPVTN